MSTGDMNTRHLAAWFAWRRRELLESSPGPKYCTSCGAANDPSASYCSGCGKSLAY